MANPTNELKNCPRCSSPTTSLVSVDTAMRLILKASDPDAESTLPNEVCKACYSQLTAMVSQGAKLRLEQQAREKNKHMMWKSRVNLVKQARQYMQQKAFSEAAVTYEKYIRVLEIAYDLKPGELGPDVFGKSAKSKELTVIATTYWDLFRIYDTNPNYRDRMMNAGNKLALFLPFSPIFPDVIKKAQTFQNSAKNPDLVRSFLKSVKANSSRCFVVTASFGYPQHPQVLFFRQFRDQYLHKTVWGRAFVRSYYLIAPFFAALIRHSPGLQKLSRQALERLQNHLTKKLAK
jgi:hypothetical protein